MQYNDSTRYGSSEPQGVFTPVGLNAVYGISSTQYAAALNNNGAFGTGLFGIGIFGGLYIPGPNPIGP